MTRHGDSLVIGVVGGESVVALLMLLYSLVQSVRMVQEQAGGGQDGWSSSTMMPA